MNLFSEIEDMFSRFDTALAYDGQTEILRRHSLRYA